MKVWVSVLFLLTSLLFSCQKESGHASTSPKDLPKDIYANGLDFIKLGDTLSNFDLNEFSIDRVEDSLEERGGYKWLTRTVHLDSGVLVLEGNFIDERQFNDLQLEFSTLNRLRVGSPHFQTAEGVSVGKSMADLLAANEGKDFRVTVLPSNGLVDLEDPEGHIHYLIEADQTVFSVILEQANRLSVIPPENLIKFIVVM